MERRRQRESFRSRNAINFGVPKPNLKGRHDGYRDPGYTSETDTGPTTDRDKQLNYLERLRIGWFGVGVKSVWRRDRGIRGKYHDR